MKKDVRRKKETRRDKAKFKRKWGVTRVIFKRMVSAFADWRKKNKDSRGRKSDLTIPQKIEVTLMYWREYRTQFHISESFNVSESTINRAIQEVENALISSGKFNIKNGKADLISDTEDEVVVDVMECEIERPKKNKNSTTRGKRKGIH